MLALVLLTVAITAGLMKWEWNFVFDRPEIFREVKEMKNISAIGYFDLGWFEDVADVSQSLKAQLNDEELYDDPYYYLSVRPLMAARARGLDAMSAPTMPDENVQAILDQFLQSGLTATSSPGYKSNKGLHGLVMAFEADSGEQMTLLAARGGQVSNDHYPYYEALFDSRMQLQQSQMFYFDVAGMEGMEFWPMLIPAATLSAIVISLASLTQVLIVSTRIRRTHGRRT